ncbi:hypothetical protein SSCG_00743 [Streptomyces clavuligerus]|nr:hypothetical protein SSCG_00743 [Streptomyces clavuligerus]
MRPWARAPALARARARARARAWMEADADRNGGALRTVDFHDGHTAARGGS